MENGDIGVGGRFSVSPNQQESVRGHAVTRWNLELKPVREIVRQKIAVQLGDTRRSVIKLEPILILASGGIQEVARVFRHPFINYDVY